MSVADSVGWSPPEKAVLAAARVIYNRFDDTHVNVQETILARMENAIRAAMEEMPAEEFIRAVRAAALFDERDWWIKERESWDRDSKNPRACKSYGKEFLIRNRDRADHVLVLLEEHALAVMNGEKRE